MILFCSTRISLDENYPPSIVFSLRKSISSWSVVLGVTYRSSFRRNIESLSRSKQISLRGPSLKSCGNRRPPSLGVRVLTRSWGFLEPFSIAPFLPHYTSTVVTLSLEATAGSLSFCAQPVIIRRKSRKGHLPDFPEKLGPPIDSLTH